MESKYYQYIAYLINKIKIKKEHYEKLKYLLNKIKEGKISKNEISYYLFSNIDVNYINDISTETLLSDIYYTIVHFSHGEADISPKEVEYFLKCLNAERKYSFKDKYLFCDWKY